MTRAARWSVLLGVLFIGPGLVLAADPPDWHISSAARVLYLKSAFVHGYMHGYEHGFHAADLDLQMGRSAREPSKIKEFQSVSGYQGSFGDKHLFESGYREGFRVGYADSYRGRRFRAITELDQAAVGLPENQSASPSALFDQGFLAGYSSGRQQGLRDGRGSAAFRVGTVRCHGSLFHPFRRGDEYCDGFGRGFHVGYSDGYSNQAPKALAQSK